MDRPFKGADEKLHFETLKEPRNGYFVEYVPYSTDARLAFVHLTFMSDVHPATIPGLMEKELHYWIERFPIQTMVSSFDNTGSLISLKNVIGSNYYVAWIDAITKRPVGSWTISDVDDGSKVEPSSAHLLKLYDGIKFRTDSQVKADAQVSIAKTVKQVRYLKGLLIVWLVIVPASVAIFQYFAPDWLSLLALALSLWQAFQTWRQLMGHKKKSQVEIDADEKDRKMRHYYYHCERNPEGFVRLMTENLEKELREKTLAEVPQDTAKNC